jgi:hypothetical protein
MARKADTRRKIQLGGIVIKAGMGTVDAYALLGLLVEQSDRLMDPASQHSLRQLGRDFASKSVATDTIEFQSDHAEPAAP